MLSIWTSLKICCLVKSFYSVCNNLPVPFSNCPARVAQWWACRTHDLVVVSSIPGWGELSFRRIFAALLCRNMLEKHLVALERKVVVVPVWESQETHVLHWSPPPPPPWYDQWRSTPNTTNQPTNFSALWDLIHVLTFLYTKSIVYTGFEIVSTVDNGIVLLGTVHSSVMLHTIDLKLALYHFTKPQNVISGHIQDICRTTA